MLREQSAIRLHPVSDIPSRLREMADEIEKVPNSEMFRGWDKSDGMTILAPPYFYQIGTVDDTKSMGIALQNIALAQYFICRAYFDGFEDN